MECETSHSVDLGGGKVFKCFLARLRGRTGGGAAQPNTPLLSKGHCDTNYVTDSFSFEADTLKQVLSL